MEYIIDGCNFIKSPADISEGGDFECRKERLLSRLRSYAAGRKVKITVVFDSGRPSLEQYGNMKVIHSRDADRRIAREAAGRKHPRSLILVSNDRTLVQRLKDMGAANMSVEDFRDFLSKSLSKRNEPEKPDMDGMSREDMLMWKKELGLG